MATALTAIGFTRDTRHAKDIIQGRAALHSTDVEQLARLLHLDAEELTRPLTAQESRAWAFYRTSARYPQELWTRVKGLLQQHGISQAQAAKIMEMRPGHLSAAFTRNPERRILSYEAAARLTDHLGIEVGPALLLEGLPPTPDQHR